MDKLNGCTVLAAGANGFLGRHLLTRLERSEANVHALSRSVPADANSVQWWQADLTNEHQICEIVASIRPDVIFHLASASHGGQDSQFVLPTFENDLRATVNMLLAAKSSNCDRVILVASLEEPILDGRPITLSSPYAAAKVACSLYALMFHQLYGVPVTILRPFMTYGPGQKSYKVIPHTILSMLQGESPKLSSGARPVDWVYVEDIISAFLTAAISPEAIGATIDLGSGQLVPIREAVEYIQQLLPDAPPPLLGALPDRMMESVRCADTQSAERILGWKATTPLLTGLSKTVDWYRQQIAGKVPVGARLPFC
jgi:nucleoside-diphosphate-sugar epimerase